MPNFVHYTGADRSDVITAGKAKTALNLRMQPREIRTHCSFVDRFQEFSSDGCRKHMDALGVSAIEIQPTIASAITAKFSVTGLKAATR